MDALAAAREAAEAALYEAQEMSVHQQQQQQSQAYYDPSQEAASLQQQHQQLFAEQQQQEYLASLQQQQQQQQQQSSSSQPIHSNLEAQADLLQDLIGSSSGKDPSATTTELLQLLAQQQGQQDALQQQQSFALDNIRPGEHYMTIAQDGTYPVLMARCAGYSGGTNLFLIFCVFS